MKSLSELAKNKSIIEEYEKAFWLKQFGDLCTRMEKDWNKNQIMQLYRETHDETEATRLIILEDRASPYA